MTTSPACGHRLCAVIDGACHLAVERSRGCRPMPSDRSALLAELVDEVCDLLATLEADAGARAAAVRLADIVVREARAGRHLLAYLRVEEPELAPTLARWCLRAR